MGTCQETAGGEKTREIKGINRDIQVDEGTKTVTTAENLAMETIAAYK